MAGAEVPAQPPERPVSHSRHRRSKNAVRQRKCAHARACVHWKTRWRSGGGAHFIPRTARAAVATKKNARVACAQARDAIPRIARSGVVLTHAEHQEMRELVAQRRKKIQRYEAERARQRHRREARRKYLWQKMRDGGNRRSIRTPPAGILGECSVVVAA